MEKPNEKKPLVQNAADPQQVANARRQKQFEEDEIVNAWRQTIKTDAGFKVILSMIKFCRVHETIWSANALIHYNAGQQDVGHFIMAMTKKADYDTLLKMMMESIKEIN